MALNYLTKEFSLDELTNENSKVKVPQFQRGLVWSKKNQKAFIQTMMDGDPFGAILLAKNGDDEYDLIDGLQRVSTIKRFLRDPEEFIDVKFIDDELFNKIVDIFKKSDKIPGAGKAGYLEDLKKHILIFYNRNDGPIDMAKELKNHFQIPNIFSDDIYGIIGDIHKNIQEKIKLNSALIPAIIYTGDKKRLPEVFARMNTGSVTLSRYEVLASTWYKYEIEIEDTEITRYVKNKYLKLKEQSFLEVNFDIDDLDFKINVFEYCYALSEILKHKKNGFHSIFGEKKKDLSTDSVGFDVIALLLGDKVNDVDRIKDFIFNAPTKFLKEFKEAIKETARELVKIIYPWISNGNNDSNQYYSVISGYQALHMFISCFNILYDFNSKEYTIDKKNNSKIFKQFKKYLPLNLFYDIISDYWSANRQVSDLHNNIVNEELLYKYTNNISRQDISNALVEYIDIANENKRKSITSESKFILNFAHKINLEKNQEYRESMSNKKLDFEHITPKERISEIIDDIPVSSIANLCVMLPRDNRSKKQLTLYEDEKSRATYKLSEKILDLMIYPKKSELNFLDLSKDQKKIEFKIFIKNRRNTLVNEISDIVSNYYT